MQTFRKRSKVRVRKIRPLTKLPAPEGRKRAPLGDGQPSATPAPGRAEGSESNSHFSRLATDVQVHWQILSSCARGKMWALFPEWHRPPPQPQQDPGLDLYRGTTCPVLSGLAPGPSCFLQARATRGVPGSWPSVQTAQEPTALQKQHKAALCTFQAPLSSSPLDITQLHKSTARGCEKDRLERKGDPAAQRNQDCRPGSRAPLSFLDSDRPLWCGHQDPSKPLSHCVSASGRPRLPPTCLHAATASEPTQAS